VAAVTHVRNVLKGPARLLVAAGASCLVLTACSGGTPADPAGERPNGTFSPGPTAAAGTPAATATAPAPAARKVPGPVLAQRFAAAATKAGTVSFTVLTTGAQDLSARGVARGSGSRGDLQISADTGGDGKIDLVRTGGDVFVKPPGGAGSVWMLATPEPSDPFNTFYQQLFVGFQSTGDVAAGAKGIARMGTFTAVGTEKVDGVPCTKYVAQPPPEQGVALLPRTYESLGPEALRSGRTTVTLWVDRSGLLHRTTTDFAAKGGQRSRALTSYRGWGKPVTITPPPAGQVVRGRPVG
jgi:hypothetical protein